MTSSCRVCGRALDDMGTCVCATERRTRDAPGLVGAMAQDRSAGGFDAFLADCVADCVGPAAPDDREHARRRDDPLRLAEWRTVLDQAEKRAAPPCPDCEGSGRVAVHICRTERECRRLCLRVEVCITCDGSGKKPKRG